MPVAEDEFLADGSAGLCRGSPSRKLGIFVWVIDGNPPPPPMAAAPKRLKAADGHGRLKDAASLIDHNDNAKDTNNVCCGLYLSSLICSPAEPNPDLRTKRTLEDISCHGLKAVDHVARRTLQNRRRGHSCAFAPGIALSAAIAAPGHRPWRPRVAFNPMA